MKSAIARRVLQDAWLEGNAIYWERRARQLEAARPRAGDHFGRATPEELRAQWNRLTAAAAACRARGSELGLELAGADLDTTLTSLGAGAAA